MPKQAEVTLPTSGPTSRAKPKSVTLMVRVSSWQVLKEEILGLDVAVQGIRGVNGA